jgi:ribosomal protein S21
VTRFGNPGAIAPLREIGRHASYGFVPLRFSFVFFYSRSSMVNCSIEVAPNESMESMWRRFRKATDRAGVYRDYARSREFMAKPQTRAAKSQRARAQAKKDGRT